MCVFKTPFKIFLAAIVCFAPGAVTAATVHSWIDAQGVTHFSDAPPAAVGIDSQTFEINDEFPAAADTEADYYSIANQWNRLRAERDAKAKLSLEKARLRTERVAARAAAATQENYDDEPNYRNYYPAYGYQNGFQPQYRGAHDSPHGDFRRGRHHVRSNGQHIGGGARTRQPRGGARFGFNFNLN